MNTAYRSYIRPGVLTTKVDGKGVVDLVLNDTVLPLYYCGHGILGWIDAAVVKSGGKHVLVEHDRCRHRGQHVCGWSVQWQ